MGAAHSLPVCDRERGQRILGAIAAHIGTANLNRLVAQLHQLLPSCPDPDMALNNLERFFAVTVSTAPQLLDRDADLEMLVTLLGTSQFFADVLVADPSAFDMLRVPLRQSPSPEELRCQLQTDVDAAYEDSTVLKAFRRFRQRQSLRIGTNDVIRERPLEEVTLDLSNVADAALEVALTTALRTMGQRFGHPVTLADAPVGCTLFAFGKLGGQELNYSSDIDLMLVYDADGSTHGRGAGISNMEFYARVVSEIVRLLSSHTERGQAYRVDLRLRPEGRRGPLARSLASTLSYYDNFGRTWERQALIKLRRVAGSAALGAEFCSHIEPFVYRKYLSFAEINEIKAMKRRIETKARQAGASPADVKAGRGGIRDIEFTIQFLQLLNGGDLPTVHQCNTLQAMLALETAGCLSLQEYQLLADAYRFLRRTEHRLQLLFDLQTHRLPENPDDLRKLALRCGYAPGVRDRSDNRRATRPRSPLDDAPPELLDTRDLLIDPYESFLHDYRDKARLNRQILDHLLHSTFADASDQAEPETDLLLAADPDDATIVAVLGRYPFRDVSGAYRNLSLLAQESVPFLSTRRCRQFLVSIAPALLRAIAVTADPDQTLRNLEQVAASLGAKAVLWELLSVSPASLKLVVEICSGSQFLTEILIHNPGMIDDLLDSLLLNRPRKIADLRNELAELCRGATDPVPIWRSFQDKELLRIGVQDLLGKATIRETTAALSDLAETLLTQVAARETQALEQRLGSPTLSDGSVCRYAILGLGKLGSRELSYHSDLDLILVYQGDGVTQPAPSTHRFDSFQPADNLYFFSELSQRLIHALSAARPTGRLYAVDMRLRPTGRSGSLAISLPEFLRYYQSTAAQLWERQALTRARIVAGNEEFGQLVLPATRAIVVREFARPAMGDEILHMRQKLEATRNERDLKRGFGGSVDIEFLVQFLQLRHGAAHKAILTANTWEALDALRHAHLLDAAESAGLTAGYDFLRQVESRLRLMTNRALDEVPVDAFELDKLARRLGYEEIEGLAARERFSIDLDRHRQQTRRQFLQIIDRERHDF